MASTRFFSRAFLDNNINRDASSFISVGEEEFQAFSTALIDAILNKKGLKDATFEKIITKFFTCYPQFKIQKSFLSFSPYMNILINSPRRAEMVACMAYVLRQLAIDEVYDKDNHLKYREIFANLSPTLPKSYLRDSTCPLPCSIFRALAQALDVSITLSIIEPEKQLRKRERYTPAVGEGQVELEMQLQNGCYFPKICENNKTYFATIGQLAIKAPQAVEDPCEKTETLASRFNSIAADNEKLKHTFNTWHNNLLVMLQSGTKDSLSHLQQTYIKFLLVPQNIFIDLKQLNSLSKNPSNTVESLTHKELLVNAIAEWITTHDSKDVDDFFVYFESLAKSQHQAKAAYSIKSPDIFMIEPSNDDAKDFNETQTLLLNHSQEDLKDLEEASSINAFR